MSINGLTIIGESINDSVPSTHDLFEKNDIEGIVALAKSQAEAGAAYIDVNIGLRSPGFMANIVKKIQEHVSLPLSIDTPDPEIAAAGLEAYSPAKAGNREPVLNSISQHVCKCSIFTKSSPLFRSCWSRKAPIRTAI